jgi:hypothetical protein
VNDGMLIPKIGFYIGVVEKENTTNEYYFLKKIEKNILTIKKFISLPRINN